MSRADAPRCERLIVTLLPIDNALGISYARFRLFRDVCFPGSRVELPFLRAEGATLNERLNALARVRRGRGRATARVVRTRSVALPTAQMERSGRARVAKLAAPTKKNRRTTKIFFPRRRRVWEPRDGGCADARKTSRTSVTRGAPRSRCIALDDGTTIASYLSRCVSRPVHRPGAYRTRQRRSFS
ncbi:MAG: hypothetical protein QM811_04800 [Pirellulales bacterium]